MCSANYQCAFSDISDDELLSATQLIEGCVSDEWWNDGSNEQLLVAASQAYDNADDSTSSATRFREAFSEEELNAVQRSRFPKNAIDGATSAVTLFGEWRGP